MQTAAIADSLQTLEHVLAPGREHFEVRRVCADEARDWRLAGGGLQHRSGGFFEVTGMRWNDGEGVFLYQPQAALTGLMTRCVAGQRQFLLQARAEPGCLEAAQFGPTLQSTPANYTRQHQGRTTPYVDCFTRLLPGATLLDDSTQIDLGERYAFKSKRSIVMEISAELPGEPSFVWATPRAITSAVLRSAFLNIDLRSILAITDWSTHEGEDDLSPRCAQLRRSLAAPIRPGPLGEILARWRHSVPERMSFAPLDGLANWRATPYGWEEVRREQGFSIEFFAVTALHREVEHWVQPLVNSHGAGRVVLACREREGLLEVWVRLRRERGLAAGSAVVPSHLCYPGQVDQPPAWLAHPGCRVWSSTIDGDEGGRFFCDASEYSLVRVDDAVQPGDADGCWLRLSELKHLLHTSNLCSIQLRGVASHLLAVQ